MGGGAWAPPLDPPLFSHVTSTIPERLVGSNHTLIWLFCDLSRNMKLLIIVRNINNDDVIRRPDLTKRSAQFSLVINRVAEHFFYFRRANKFVAIMYAKS